MATTNTMQARADIPVPDTYTYRGAMPIRDGSGTQTGERLGTFIEVRMTRDGQMKARNQFLADDDPLVEAIGVEAAQRDIAEHLHDMLTQDFAVGTPDLSRLGLPGERIYSGPPMEEA